MKNSSAMGNCWDNMLDNIRAIGLTIAAMRSIERAGADELMGRVFQGFTALPAPRGAPSDWWVILGVARTASVDEIKHAYREQARVRHPDKGGTKEAMMQELNDAYERALSQVA